MFYYLNGTVAYIAPYLAVIDCNGVGYACKTTNYTLSTIKKGEKPSYTPFSTSGKTEWISLVFPLKRS